MSKAMAENERTQEAERGGQYLRGRKHDELGVWTLKGYRKEGLALCASQDSMREEHCRYHFGCQLEDTY